MRGPRARIRKAGRSGVLTPSRKEPVNSTKEIFVGIDVSKASLDIHVLPSGEAWTTENEADAIARLVSRLRSVPPTLITLEATGGLERRLLASLLAASLPAVAMNPRQVRDFAKGLGILAKTDAIDARILALFAEKARPEVRPLPDAQTQELEALMVRRRQVIDMLTAEKNRLGSAPPSKRVARAIRKTIEYLERQLEDFDKDIDDAIRQSPAWRDKDEILQSVPGVGPVLSRTLLGHVPEFGTLRRQKMATLIGVAPLNCDSGKYRGQRHCWGGRTEVRNVLYMATLSAIRYNPVIRAFFERISPRKLRKVAIVACMHKLLTILNAMVRSNSRWSPPLSA